jgi:hypothetical protein
MIWGKLSPKKFYFLLKIMGRKMLGITKLVTLFYFMASWLHGGKQSFICYRRGNDSTFSYVRVNLVNYREIY